MRKLLISIFFISLYGCSNKNFTSISYSPFFKINVPTQQLVDSTFFKSDGIAIKFQDSSLLSGYLISKDTSGLGGSFNMNEYPEYLFGLKDTDELDKSKKTLFINSQGEINYTYGSQSVVKIANERKTIYLKCKDKLCISFITKSKITDQILMITGSNIKPETLMKILKGV